ncbi:hypothetical protein Tco_1070637 [Tanacetum coccineum]|uniref:Uncharacterized protein n=1 Tax=Tanacetum coccineum TaxID=301880 RepID=A0ABQ5HNV7_9ASTR
MNSLSFGGGLEFRDTNFGYVPSKVVLNLYDHLTLNLGPRSFTDKLKGPYGKTMGNVVETVPNQRDFQIASEHLPILELRGGLDHRRRRTQGPLALESFLAKRYLRAEVIRITIAFVQDGRGVMRFRLVIVFLLESSTSGEVGIPFQEQWKGIDFLERKFTPIRDRESVGEEVERNDSAPDRLKAKQSSIPGKSHAFSRRLSSLRLEGYGIDDFGLGIGALTGATTGSEFGAEKKTVVERSVPEPEVEAVLEFTNLESIFENHPSTHLVFAEPELGKVELGEPGVD